MALKIASVAPLVTVTSASGSGRWPYSAPVLSAIASRRAAMPVIGAYWLWPARIARSSASTRRAGTSKSGKPWPRLTAPCSAASCDITVKMVVPTLGSLVPGIAYLLDPAACRDAPSLRRRPRRVKSRSMTQPPHIVSEADASRLATAYLEANYRWACSGDWHDIRIGLPVPGLALLYPGVGSFGLLSAWNPYSQPR